MEISQTHEDNLFLIKAPKGTVKLVNTDAERLELFNKFSVQLFFLKMSIDTREREIGVGVDDDNLS